MTTQQIAFVFIIAGVVLMILELMIPGLVTIFFGISAVMIGLLYWLGFFYNIAYAIFLWFILSLVLILAFRKIALKFFPSDSKYQLVEDDVDAIGAIVDVLQTIDEKSSNGRISYNGTSWPATSNGGVIEKGKKAKLLYRDNISWIVESVETTVF
jgi:membrane protein implicated in regulation of membrane protease activity